MGNVKKEKTVMFNESFTSQAREAVIPRNWKQWLFGGKGCV